MPTLSVEKDALFASIGKTTYSDEAFDELCFEFGVELDEITSEREEALKSNPNLTKKQLEAYSDHVIYKIDVPANRYDLLCVEGLSRALKIFLGDLQAPEYKTVPGSLVMTVETKAVNQIRPFVVCAVLRNIEFNQQRYQSFIDLQDQLHRNLCRQRTLVAIGTHNLDTLAPPFTYTAKAPSEISFVPLTPDNQGEFTADKLMEFYETDPSAKHLKPYVGIIKDSPVYPVIYDATGVVLSLPPIINGSHSKITLDTRNVLIECTATDLTKANIVLDTVVCMFSEYCNFEAESVQVNYDDDDDGKTSSYTTPQLSTRVERASVDMVNSLIGISLEPEQMQTLCNKVQLGPATLLVDDDILQVTVPPTRSDILHAVDIAEDIGIAYGYNNIKKTVPKTNTIGREQPLNHLGDLLRQEISRAGYLEVLTHGLCSWHDVSGALNRKTEKVAVVSLSNPANVEYQVVRTTLLPGLLKTLQHNKKASFKNGMKLFEISDVVVQSSNQEKTGTVVGAKNVRRVCAVYAGPTSGFEILHGLVDRILQLCQVKAAAAEDDDDQGGIARPGWTYQIAELLPSDDDELAGTYFPGRAAQVVLTTTPTTTATIGTFGILHPDVLQNFDVLYPASSLELDLEALL